jgi:FG-GAP repeat/FG-GAP-like repeat/Tetratricopeptide repeat
MRRALIGLAGGVFVLTVGMGLAATQQGQGIPPASQQIGPTLADAMARLQARDPAGAAKLAQEITLHEPGNAQAWRLLGIARQQAKDIDGAIAAYMKALELVPNHPVALFNLGTAWALKGDVEQAFDWLGKAKATHRIDMSQAATDEDLDALKKDPRFGALLPKPADFLDPFVEPVKVIREWQGEAANDQFGWIARNVGDVDGDGVPDVVTSAPMKVIGGGPAGRIYVYSTKTGALLWTADGEVGDQFGIGVEGAGDTNHDGIPDVIAAAPGGGYAKVFSGRDGRVLLTLTAERKEDAFGQHVSHAGDVNHDGYADVIVGAPNHEAGGPHAGRAYIYSGKDGSVLLTLTGGHAGDGFGSTVTGGTDAGTTLIIVGAPTAGPSKHGRAYVYDGLTSTPKFVIDADETGGALGGMFVALPGDVDADGTPDVYVSDWPNAARGPQTGRVYVHSGRDGHRLFAFTGETAGEGFGTSPSNAGDVDGDGHADFIVGAWQYGGAAASGGRAYLYSGKDGRLMKTITCRITGDAFGFDAVGMGDVDGDGTVDFLITSAWSGVKGFHSGRMFIISSGIARAPRR